MDLILMMVISCSLGCGAIFRRFLGVHIPVKHCCFIGPPTARDDGYGAGQSIPGRKCTGFLRGHQTGIAVGGVIITVLTLMVGDHRFNGAGMDMALEAVEGNADWYSSVLKLFFTAVTPAPGFKGSEIVPTFLYGAIFG